MVLIRHPFARFNGFAVSNNHIRLFTQAIASEAHSQVFG